MVTLASAKTALKRYADPAKAVTYRTFFKHCTDDIFLGVTMPLVRRVVKEHCQLPLAAIRKLMQSRIHEERTLAHAILVLQFQNAEDENGKKRIFQFYLRSRRFIRDWDGVDDSAPYIVGPYLLHRDKAILYELVCSNSIWDRRIALVATLPLIRQGVVDDTLKLAAEVLNDREDLIHKAAGWMLREVGKRNLGALIKFLSRHRSEMPRTMLRYAIERFPKTERRRYMKLPLVSARNPSTKRRGAVGLLKAFSTCPRVIPVPERHSLPLRPK